MQELVGNRKFADAAEIQKEIDQLRAECEATVSSVAALEPGLRALSLKEGRTLQLIKSAAHYARSEIAAAEKKTGDPEERVCKPKPAKAKCK